MRRHIGTFPFPIFCRHLLVGDDKTRLHRRYNVIFAEQFKVLRSKKLHVLNGIPPGSGIPLPGSDNRL